VLKVGRCARFGPDGLSAIATEKQARSEVARFL
jgi:hypothetical protein